MILIDSVASRSPLARADPLGKLVFAVLTLCICLAARSLLLSIVVVLVMGWITVRRGGVSLGLYVKLLRIPLAFLAVGVLTVAVNFSSGAPGETVLLRLGSLCLSGSRAGMLAALRLFFRALGAVSCLYFLSLTTPMLTLLSLFRRLKVPRTLIEMMELVYRFIFVLLETAQAMVTAQSSRLGYSSLPSGFRSLGAMISTLFLRAYRRASALYTALEARGYDGELRVLEEPLPIRFTAFFVPLCIDLALIGVAWLARGLPGEMP